MSVRVVARIRPLLQLELDKDVIIEAVTGTDQPIVKIPNPRKESEAYSFQFNSVYDHHATQQQIFDDEVSPTIKSLFKGLDVTIFAYGVTGTGKTHTMRGGKTLADRGVIPRLLSSIYRRSRKVEKDSEGQTQVEVSMAYYEIYCDRVYDLFEAPEKRTPAGLPIRDNGGKTVVVGLTERPCTSLKEFEQLYDQANINRSTSATKLNAHSSRSHAILSVKVTQTTGDQMRVSTVSAIDLAGSEDNRRTDNGKERMVESAAINKSLFVLAQCVEAISKKQSRIPYRESRMTRILSLGQNNGITVMILNLSPIRSYHLDTLSSLNFANRTKKIEVNEVENQPIFRNPVKADPTAPSTSTGTSMMRQPLRPKNFSTNVIPKDTSVKTDKMVKSFMVYSDRPKPAMTRPNIIAGQGQVRDSHKRTSSEAVHTLGRPSKVIKHNDSNAKTRSIEPGMTAESIEAMIDRKVAEKLAESAMNVPLPATSTQDLSSEVQARLDALERKVGAKETEKSEGLQYLLMAKQHQVRGEDGSALKMYQLALPFFPENEKLSRKILALEEKMRRKTDEKRSSHLGGVPLSEQPQADYSHSRSVKTRNDDENEDADLSYSVPQEAPSDSDDDFAPKKHKPRTKLRLPVFRDDNHTHSDDDELARELALSADVHQTPRTKNLLRIINTRDVSQIRLLKGVGAKKAEAIVNCLCELDIGRENQVEDDDDAERSIGAGVVRSLGQLGRLRGVGVKGVEKMREGLGSVA